MAATATARSRSGTKRLITPVQSGSNHSFYQSPADQWSDLDLIVLTADLGPYAGDAWLSELGMVWAACVEEANPGDPDVQAIFEDGVKGDFTFITVENGDRPIDVLPAELPYQGVLSRRGRVLFDSSDPKAPERSLPERAVHALSPPTEKEYVDLVTGFWSYATRVAKFTSRGDLWRAMFNLVDGLNLRLLKLMEWHAQATGALDSWYDGRFIEEWAGPIALEALPGQFPHYDAADLRRAPMEAIELFRLLAQQTADRLGYEYPSEMDTRISP